MNDLNNFHKITIRQHDALLECYFKVHPNKYKFKLNSLYITCCVLAHMLNCMNSQVHLRKLG
jgi:hypothetical protein